MQWVKKQDLPHKICLTCGKPFSWRKKWEKVWDDVNIVQIDAETTVDIA